MYLHCGNCGKQIKGQPTFFLNGVPFCSKCYAEEYLLSQGGSVPDQEISTPTFTINGQTSDQMKHDQIIKLLDKINHDLDELKKYTRRLDEDRKRDKRKDKIFRKGIRKRRQNDSCTRGHYNDKRIRVGVRR